MEGKEYTSIDQLPLVLSVAQLAAVLGIGINSAYQLVRSNIIRSIRIGRQYKIPRNALEAYLYCTPKTFAVTQVVIGLPLATVAKVFFPIGTRSWKSWMPLPIRLSIFCL